MFGIAPAAIPQTSSNPTGAESDFLAVEAEPQIPIREYFDPQNRDKIVVIIKHLASPEKVLLALDNMDEAQVDVDRLGLLVKLWDTLEIAGLISEYQQDKDKENTVWNTTEKYLIDLNV